MTMSQAIADTPLRNLPLLPAISLSLIKLVLVVGLPHERSLVRIATMQGGFRAILSNGSVLKNTVLQHVRLVNPVMRPLMFSRHESASAARIEEHGFESTTISDILKGKGKSADGSWLWCTTDDSVYDAVKSMTQHNVGALVVVKPGEQNAIAGIITERGQAS